MGKLYIFNFDGTCNTPEDADQSGNKPDDGISNILKLHLLLGGSLVDQGRGWPACRQHSYYYAGIGTYGDRFQRTINALFAPEGSDVRHILRRALADFILMDFDPACDCLLVTGFSRGAALARRFARLISDRVSTACIYELVFDTVASIENPDLSMSRRPKSEVVFEDCTLPKQVIKALHLVALDEKRRAFQPTLMNREARVTEVWLPGAHSDIGGGFFSDGLSDFALNYGLKWLVEEQIGVEIKGAADIDYQAILPDGVDYQLDVDDLRIEPNLMADSHEQQRSNLLELVTLSDRLCCVIEQDRVVTNGRPLLHSAVIERMERRSDYRPTALNGVPYILVT
jgi:hypothetical protein